MGNEETWRRVHICLDGDFMTSPGFIGWDVAVPYTIQYHTKSRDRITLGVRGRSFWDESWEGPQTH